jgi:glycosyltransferase involved in cell wall biosynthesis
MKILILNYLETTSPGGINKVIVEIAKNLSKRGHEVTVLQPNPSDLESEELYGGYKIIRVSSRFDKYLYGLNLEMYQYLKKHLKDLNPDIIHVHGYHSLLPIETIGTIKRIDPNIPIIFSPHLDVIKSTFAGKYLWSLYNVFARGVFKQSSYITSCSEFEAENIGLLGVDPDKIAIICHGVDLIDYMFIDETEEDVNEFDHNKKIKLLYSGYLVHRKGVDFILNSLNMLVNDTGIKDVVLTIVGDGPEKQKLLKKAADLNLHDYIVWKSFLPREDLIKEIKGADIFMLLSRSEAYGISVAEVLAMGTPCIITNRTALKEFKDEPGCFLVDYPPKPKEVAELALNIIKSDVTVGPLTEKIRTWNEVSMDYERLYEEVLSEEVLSV